MAASGRHDHGGAVIVALLWLIAACGGPDEPAEPPEPPAVLVGSEDVATARRQTLTTGPRLAGSLEPAQRASLRAETSGTVLDVLAEVGEEVEPGELLARVEDQAAVENLRAAQAAVQAARTDLSATARDRDRTETLVDAGALAERDLEVARTAVAAAKARLDQAEAQAATAREVVGNAEIRAPIEGVVARRSVGIGDVVAPGAELFEIVDPSSLRLEAGIPASAVESLEVGAQVRFQVQGLRRPLLGRIERIAPEVTAGTRQIAVLVSVPNTDRRLPAGLFAEGRVATEVAEGVVVPLDAVETYAGESAVMRIEGGVVERVVVETGLVDEDGEQVLITGGLSAGDVVLVGAARDVEPGTPVRVEERRTEAPPAGTGG